MTYSASLDQLAKIITIVVTAGLLAFYFFLRDSDGFLFWFGFIALVFIISYALSPLRYELEQDRLVIHRLIKPVIILRADVSEVRLLEAEDKKGVLRTFGSGGFFGYFGHFWNKRLGRFMMYATRRDHLVFFEKKDGKKIVISPDDENFIFVLKRQWKFS